MDALQRDDSSDDLHQIKSIKDSWGQSSDEDRGTGTSGTSDDLGSSSDNRIQANTNVKLKSSPLGTARVIHNPNTSKFDDFYSTQGPTLSDRTKDNEITTVSESYSLYVKTNTKRSQSLPHTPPRRNRKKLNGPKRKILVRARLVKYTKASIVATGKL